MNLQLLHILNLCFMICNLYFHHWVIWAGTLELLDYIPVDLNLNWGLYTIEIESSTLLNEVSIYLSIPDFLEFMNSNFNIEVIKPTTIPLYYSVSILYIFLFLSEVYNVIESVLYRNVEYDKLYITERNLLYRTIMRVVCSCFILTSLFTSYNTESLCMNDYIMNYNATIFEPVSVKVNSETCTYGWNFLFILCSEVFYLIELIYIYWIYFNTRKRSTSDFSQNANLDFYVNVDTFVNGEQTNIIHSSLDKFLNSPSTSINNSAISPEKNVSPRIKNLQNSELFISGKSMRKNLSRHRLNA